jgi:hypothetical protein
MEQVTMAQYSMETNPAILTTSAPDGTYRHPGGEVGTWNGFAVPHATFAELLKYSQDALAFGERHVIRPYLLDGECLVILFPCDGECDQVSSGDFWDLGNDEHAHHDEAMEWFLTDETEPVYVDGLIWDVVEDDAETN